MIWWVSFMVILTVLSYLNDTGVVSFLKNVRIPLLEASLLSFLILVGTAGILIRMLWMRRRGEKEGLHEKIRRLEQELSKSRP
jgi:spore maturation protein SpmA